jgi:hypothetical protein
MGLHPQLPDGVEFEKALAADVPAEGVGANGIRSDEGGGLPARRWICTWIDRQPSHFPKQQIEPGTHGRSESVEHDVRE